jgi:hypothetical protein
MEKRARGVKRLLRSFKRRHTVWTFRRGSGSPDTCAGTMTTPDSLATPRFLYKTNQSCRTLLWPRTLAPPFRSTARWYPLSILPRPLSPTLPSLWQSRADSTWMTLTCPGFLYPLTPLNMRSSSPVAGLLFLWPGNVPSCI